MNVGGKCVGAAFDFVCCFRVVSRAESGGASSSLID